MRSLHTRTDGSDGFTLVEILVVLGIVAVLMAIAVPVFFSEKDSAKNNAMRNAAGTIMAGFGQFNTDYPFFATDPLVTHANYCGSWTSDQMWSSAHVPIGMQDATGAPYVHDWPSDPFTSKPITVLRANTGCTASGSAKAVACTAVTPKVGAILICRPPTSGAGSHPKGAYEVIAWGAKMVNGQLAPVQVYSQIADG